MKGMRPDMSGVADPPPGTPGVFQGVRFLLEIAGWVGFGIWGWHLGGGGVIGAVLATGFVVATMAIWGVFRVRHDPPGKTDQPVVVPGWVRLAIEIGFFALAAYGMWIGWSRVAAETLLTAVGLLYLITLDRQKWLLRQ